jgi:hypothetical protein
MLTYVTLQDRPRGFLAATSLTHEEFARVLPAFAAAYAVRYSPDKTWEGKGHQRQQDGPAFIPDGADAECVQPAPAAPVGRMHSASRRRG